MFFDLVVRFLSLISDNSSQLAAHLKLSIGRKDTSFIQNSNISLSLFFVLKDVY